MEQDPWGHLYKTIMCKIKPEGSVPICPANLDRAGMFATHRDQTQRIGLTKGDDVPELPEVTKVEVRTPSNRICIRKA